MSSEGPNSPSAYSYGTEGSNWSNPTNAYSEDDTFASAQVGNNACFILGTKILMGDGSEKKIEEVTIGDFVKSYDQEKKEIVTSKVVRTTRHPHDFIEFYFVINGFLRITGNHEIYVNKSWKRTDEAKVGDFLQDINGKEIKIISIEKIKDYQETFNFEVKGTKNYYAEEILVHNGAKP